MATIKTEVNIRYFLTLALFLILTHCASQTQSPQSVTSSLPTSTEQTLEHAFLLEQQAKNETDNIRRNELLLSASYIYTLQRQYFKAETLLEQLSVQQLNNTQAAIFTVVKAQIQEATGKRAEALQHFNEIDKPDSLPVEIQYLVTDTKSSMLLRNGDFISSISERVYLSPLLNKEQKKINNNAIWKTLSLLKQDELKSAMEKSNYSDIRNWLELAYISKAYQHDIEIQNQKIESWLQQNDNKELTNNLPPTISLIKEALKNRPKKIAILLPETGIYSKSAEAISRGFLSQHYRSLNEKTFTPELVFFNTDEEQLKKRYTSDSNKKEADETELLGTQKGYQEKEPVAEKESAIEKGFLLTLSDIKNHKPDLIIGPLNKDLIRVIATQKQNTIPTLALNYTDANDNPELYQYGLAPEDEITFISKQAQQRKYKYAAILAPDNPWGQRLSEYFQKQWEKSGGETVSTAYYDNTSAISKVIENMLNIDASEKRFKRLYWYSGGKTLSYSRRRQDVDFIYLIGTPEHARQIMPLFVFHDASDIPVFSSSNVYSGEYNTKDRDLNSLLFTEIPAMVTPGREMSSLWKNQDYRYKRLIAMGVDTYNLSIRLNILASSQDVTLFGETGILSMDENGNIKREPVLAKFSGGNILLQADKFN